MATREETKRMIEVMQAYVDGKEIYNEDSYITQPNWNWAIVKYRTKPKTRKVKLLAYLNQEGLFWRRDSVQPYEQWKRVPQLDYEIEIEE